MFKVSVVKAIAAMGLLFGGVLAVPEIAAQPKGNPGARKDAYDDSPYKGRLRGVNEVGLVTDISGLESCSIPKRAIREAFALDLTAASLRVHGPGTDGRAQAADGFPVVTLSIDSNNMVSPWAASRPYNPYSHCMTCVALSVNAPANEGDGGVLWQRKSYCLLGPARTVQGDAKEYVRQLTEQMIAHWKRDNATQPSSR